MHNSVETIEDPRITVINDFFGEQVAAEIRDRHEHTVAGHGASGHANTIIRYCNITHDHMECMIDDAPSKHGFYTPGSHFLIRPNTVLAESAPITCLFSPGAISRQSPRSVARTSTVAGA